MIKNLVYKGKMLIASSAVTMTILFGLLPQNALAADDEISKLNGIISNSEFQQRIINAAKRSSVVINAPCPSSEFSITNKLAIYKPLTFDNSGALSGGAWKHVVQEQGCGKIRVLNVLAFVQGPKTLVTMPLLPGTTHGDFFLQRDAVQYAVIAAGGPEQNCATGYITDTEFLGYEGKVLDGAKGAPWREVWTMLSCTKKSQVMMHFIPDKTGTRIVTTQQETKTFSLEPK